MRVNANAVLRSWTLLAAFGGSYAPGIMHLYRLRPHPSSPEREEEEDTVSQQEEVGETMTPMKFLWCALFGSFS